MIDPARQAAFLSPAPIRAGQAQHSPDKPVFRMIASDRMGGSVPAWIPPSSAQERALSTLSRAGRNDAALPGNALAYRGDAAGTAGQIDAEPFGFGDVIDIVNPLQHIPVVGALYRHLTGDQIRPSSSIIGGALFGGPLGAAGGLANVIVREKSGRDLGEHALQLAGAEIPARPAKTATPAGAPDDSPLQRLATAGQPPQLPSSALGFLDMAYRAQAPISATPPTPQNHARIAALYKFND